MTNAEYARYLFVAANLKRLTGKHPANDRDNTKTAAEILQIQKINPAGVADLLQCNDSELCKRTRAVVDAAPLTVKSQLPLLRAILPPHRSIQRLTLHDLLRLVEGADHRNVYLYTADNLPFVTAYASKRNMAGEVHLTVTDQDDCDLCGEVHGYNDNPNACIE